METKIPLLTPPRPQHKLPPHHNLAEEAAMRHSTARRIDPTKPATKRQAPKASSTPRSPAHRPKRIDALREELERIARDIKELEQDYETRIGPLARAYAAAVIKLEKLAPTPGKKPRPGPTSRFTEPSEG